ncbi:MAG: hypothetical protein IPF67_13400 [Saprospiraceae bacterium]|nr:hypothetical protein [Candidatus Brachybacter algidus]
MTLWYAEENNIRLNSIPTLRDDIDGKPTSEIGVSEYGKIYWINTRHNPNQQVTASITYLRTTNNIPKIKTKSLFTTFIK